MELNIFKEIKLSDKMFKALILLPTMIILLLYPINKSNKEKLLNLIHKI